jgi:hypothetical protein
MKRATPETFYTKVHRLLAEGKKLSSPQDAQVVGAFDNGLTTFLIVFNQKDDGFALELEKPVSFNVFDQQGNAL